VAKNDRYPVPAARSRVEDEVEKSRFIATLGPAPTPDAARALIASVREEFPDATHHCYAFVAGPPGTTGAAGSGDDGEPPGTAGRPMLTVLLNSGLGDVAVVVTRYFGGVKLGRGGLVRAYSGAVQHALRGAATALRVERVDVSVRCAWSRSAAVERVLVREEGDIRRKDYGSDVTFLVRVPADRLEAVTRALMDATSGGVCIERAE
jgi:uncharacterized YigZ family protein